ncbi:DUF2807 domain-containing protein [Rhodocytophaga rosea]|uniref:DUF2807 domain-containing protein n=1 Tax=Rhodocytophaga rosea TaxID=2704465 RepID=A0A6C0GRL1_9BACT|nr:head GIN domain-containing protein [Rhodocytophaga rosea]QHT70708.1 DUF2807 domain-containing protein [Rhodocytophaga rosea]
MKIRTLFLSLLLSGLYSLNSFAQENTVTRKIGSFDKVELSGPFEIHLKKGDQSALTIETEDLAPEDIITEVRNNTLHVELADKKFKYKDFDSKSVVYLTYTQLKRLSWNGAGNIKTESVLEADKFELDISGAGNVNMDLKVNTLSVDMSGAGNVEMKGQARTQTIQMSGAGNYNGFELKSEKANVELSGVGNVRVYTTEELNASASGVGAIRYKGNPRNVIKNSSGFLGSVKSAD